jgi:hypothetical protein
MNFEIAPKETEAFLNWFDAKLYCFALNIDGKIGWRLPTKEELDSIYHSENDFGSYYWSVTESINNQSLVLSFSNGWRYIQFKTNRFYVRAVRDL